MKREFRTDDSVISDESLLVYNAPGGYYHIVGSPRKYQGMLETIKVLFPDLDVRMSIPSDLGSAKVAGVANAEGTDGIQFVLHETAEGKEYDLAENPEDFAAILFSITEWREDA